MARGEYVPKPSPREYMHRWYADDEYYIIAREIFDQMLEYEVKDESVSGLIKKLTLEYDSTFTQEEQNKISIDIIRVMSIEGYDIDQIKPFKMKKYM